MCDERRSWLFVKNSTARTTLFVADNGSRVRAAGCTEVTIAGYLFRRPVNPRRGGQLPDISITPMFLRRRKEADVGRIIVANRRGHQVVEWSTTDTDESRETIAEAERILREARAAGCAVSKKVDGVHVVDKGEFDPAAEEYQVLAPIVGG
jgi:hypothetical protein